MQFGCDKFCTYCVVPSTRGPEQGRPPEHIAAEVRQLAAEGCKEVVLLGQTVNSYKYDRGDGRRVRLSDLLEDIHDTAGIERIKLLTSENAQLRAELGSVKDRLETIERIVTDEPSKLARDIDALTIDKGGNA